MEQNRKSPPPSDIGWYMSQYTGEREEFYACFFKTCKYYNVMWSTASPQVQKIIETITRFNFACEQAKRRGLPLSSVPPAFRVAGDKD